MRPGLNELDWGCSSVRVSLPSLNPHDPLEHYKRNKNEEEEEVGVVEEKEKKDQVRS